MAIRPFRLVLGECLPEARSAIPILSIALVAGATELLVLVAMVRRGVWPEQQLQRVNDSLCAAYHAVGVR